MYTFLPILYYCLLPPTSSTTYSSYHHLLPTVISHQNPLPVTSYYGATTSPTIIRTYSNHSYIFIPKLYSYLLLPASATTCSSHHHLLPTIISYLSIPITCNPYYNPNPSPTVILTSLILLSVPSIFYYQHPVLPTLHQILLRSTTLTSEYPQFTFYLYILVPAILSYLLPASATTYSYCDP